MKILVTGGGTREPIDSVRFVSNFSTGATSLHLVEAFLHEGWQVHFLRARGTTAPNSNPNLVVAEFTTFQDLDKALKKLLENEKFDVIVHAAAVSDFSITRIEQAGMSMAPLTDMKLSSDQPITIKMTPNHKIVERLKSYSKKGSVQVIGFKLTSTPVETERRDAIQKLFGSGAVDLVVHNDLSEISSGTNSHKGAIYNSAGLLARFQTKDDLAKELIKLLKELK